MVPTPRAAEGSTTTRVGVAVPYPGLSEPSASVGGTQVPVQRPGSVLPPPPPPPLSVAEQVVAVVLVPPLIPLQPHVQGPEPETAVALVPATQRFVEGALANDPPLLVPQAPLTVWLAVQAGESAP